jgi:hypothetical protein
LAFDQLIGVIVMHSEQHEENFTLDPSTTSALNHDDRDNLTKIMECEDADPGSSGRFIYGRYSNPTVARTERKLADIFHALGESRAWVALASSGMAAIDCVLSLLCPLRGRAAAPPLCWPSLLRKMAQPGDAAAKNDWGEDLATRVKQLAEAFGESRFRIFAQNLQLP